MGALHIWGRDKDMPFDLFQNYSENCNYLPKNEPRIESKAE